MDSTTLIIGLASVLAAAAPVVFAVIGETISERAGVINLSMNGTILLAAMGSFAVAVQTENLFLGFLTGMLIGALVAQNVIGEATRYGFGSALAVIMMLISSIFITVYLRTVFREERRS